MSDTTLVTDHTGVARTDDLAVPTPNRNFIRAYWGNFGFSLIIAAVILFTPDLPDTAVGVLTILLSIVAMVSGIHVGIAIMGAGAVGLWKLAGTSAVAVTFEDVPFTSAASWSLSVIPLFILMGVAMGRFNLTGKLFTSAQAWLGRLPGGLAVSTNFAGAGLAASSGSSIAISYALGRTTIPEMLRAGYKPSLATGVVAMSGTLGMLIPPSVVLVIYAGVAETPVGPQLLAALIPGLLTALAYGVVIVVRCSIDPTLGPRSTTHYTWGQRLRSLVDVTPVTLILILIIGGMYTGIFTPTEAGAFGAIAAILLGWLFGDDRSVGHLVRTVLTSLRETAAGVASIFLLLMGVHVLTRVVALSGVADWITETITSLGLSRTLFLLGLIFVFLILGMFMDGLAMILLTVPILMPVLATFDISLLWFGVFMVILVELALVTPPIGMLSYIVHRIASNPEVNEGMTVRLSDVFKGVSWFVVTSAVILVALIFFPEIALWLPETSAAE
ncbi:MAG: TRAP transporter large permease [Dietzia sp.]|uniref:TRAP transporter large permease n=1 Tax=Dietzia cercidiphylli TaxID=498199 RepID=A0ABN2I7Y5_9ACTN|nr:MULTISPECIES: TRAP transporter large permease [Dietzia]MBB1040124.1 TRAP transporter large permease [Dietzia sp. Cai40]MBB1045135.1 TRAP transporter large permease [Dietzia sp. DQ11-44]MBB1046403.1 TRAP transporter large permease [Dietzia cercidiphylli]MBB1052402.1 TRAP transporter large permease [Dietzia sp. CW19]MBB1052886.1 TRAP transporter large permease [Dietzia sp. B44]